MASTPSSSSTTPPSTTSPTSASCNAALEKVATPEPFPVFEEDTTEGTPSSSSPSLPPPPAPLPLPPRRRSRAVNENDLRAFRGLPKKKVFDYVDLVKCLREPSAPGKLPQAPTSQLGKDSTYTRASSDKLKSFSPAPWAQ